MSKFGAKMVTSTSMTVMIDNKPYTADSSHPNWNRLREALKDTDEARGVASFLACIDIPKAVANVVKTTALAGKVEVVNDQVLYNGQPLHNSVTSRMLDMLREGFNIDPLIKFLENLMQNPSKHSVDQLYSFLEHKNMPITEDGCVIGYKSVKDNYLDKYSGTISNTPGSVVSVPRNMVADSPQDHCAAGLHIGALEYSGPGGWYNKPEDRVILCKFNPKDVVSVPNDHNFTKLRVCEYTVVDDFKGALNRAVYSGAKIGDDDFIQDEYSYDEDYDYDSCDELSTDELEDGDDIRFDYTHDNETKHRYAHIDEIGMNNDRIHCTMNYPDSDAGQFRTFLFDRMKNIQLDEQPA